MFLHMIPPEQSRSPCYLLLSFRASLSGHSALTIRFSSIFRYNLLIILQDNVFGTPFRPFRPISARR